jgi:hypothetical protein
MDGAVSTLDATFEEASATQRVAYLPMAHVSLELGHLYMEDFAGGSGRLKEMFRQVAPWANVVREVCSAAVAPKTPRISTCFLVDDYFGAFSTPSEVVPMLVDAADAVDLRIDYLARESACAQAGDVPLAEIVASRLVPDPPPGTNGTRPPVQETGWLCNGVRSPQPILDEAMRPSIEWRPPSENGAYRHSIFVDIELWKNLRSGQRQWSCPFLASVWQLLRLGMLRMRGHSVIEPTLWTGTFPEAWESLPPVAKLHADAAPFSAYRTFSVLANRFLPIEHAVRTILSQIWVEQAVAHQISQRAEGEQLALPLELVDRVEYVFGSSPWRTAG